jgi:hypothetical protein
MTDYPNDLRTIAEGFAASGDNHIAEKLRDAADEIERLRTLLGDCRADRQKLLDRQERHERLSKKSGGWRKKT